MLQYFLVFSVVVCAAYTYTRSHSTADKIGLVSIVCNLVFVIVYRLTYEYFLREKKRAKNRQQKSNKRNENENEQKKSNKTQFGGQTIFIKLERTSPAWRHYSSIFSPLSAIGCFEYRVTHNNIHWDIHSYTHVHPSNHWWTNWPRNVIREQQKRGKYV